MALRIRPLDAGWEDTCQVRCYNPDEITVAFDDERLVADAGLLLPATLAVGLGLRELLDATWTSARPRAPRMPAAKQ
jgi:hypothetical protein